MSDSPHPHSLFAQLSALSTHHPSTCRHPLLTTGHPLPSTELDRASIETMHSMIANEMNGLGVEVPRPQTGPDAGEPETAARERGVNTTSSRHMSKHRNTGPLPSPVEIPSRRAHVTSPCTPLPLSIRPPTGRCNQCDAQRGHGATLLDGAHHLHLHADSGQSSLPYLLTHSANRSVLSHAP